MELRRAPRALLTSLAASFLLVASPARADEEDSTAKGRGNARDEPHHASFLFSPIPLLLPMLEGGVELRADRRLGIALLGGYGSMPAHHANAIAPRFGAWEVATQFVGYPIGDFDRGAQLGAEVSYFRESGSSSRGPVLLDGVGTSVGAGPFVGYKFVASFGLTVSGQLGFKYVLDDWQTRASNATSASEVTRHVAPFLHLYVGWSF